MSAQGCCGGGGREGAIGFGALDEGFGGGERGGGAGRRRSLGLHGEEHVLAGTASPYTWPCLRDTTSARAHPQPEQKAQPTGLEAALRRLPNMVGGLN